MRIDDGRKNEDLAAYLKRSSKIKATSKDSQSSTPPVKGMRETNISDNVELSEKVKDLQGAQRILEAAPEMRNEKVGEIKEQVTSGSYDVEDEAIADSIIKDALIDQVI